MTISKAAVLHLGVAPSGNSFFECGKSAEKNCFPATCYDRPPTRFLLVNPNMTAGVIRAKRTIFRVCRAAHVAQIAYSVVGPDSIDVVYFGWPATMIFHPDEMMVPYLIATQMEEQISLPILADTNHFPRYGAIPDCAPLIGPKEWIITLFPIKVAASTFDDRQNKSGCEYGLRKMFSPAILVWCMRVHPSELPHQNPDSTHDKHKHQEAKGYHAVRNFSGGDHAALPVVVGVGREVPAASATSFRCAKRDCGMPIFRQLKTVEVGASISFATAEVPPRASITATA